MRKLWPLALLPFLVAAKTCTTNPQTGVRAELVVAPVATIEAGQPMPQFQARMFGIDANGAHIDKGADLQLAHFAVKLFDADVDMQSTTVLLGPVGGDDDPDSHMRLASLGASFTGIVIETPGRYRLRVECSTCTETQLSDIIVVTEAKPVRTAYVTCVLASGTAAVYGGASELSSGSTAPKVDGDCETTAVINEGTTANPVVKSIGMATCTSGATLNVSCTQTAQGCSGFQPGGSATAGAAITAAWAGGDVPTGSTMLTVGDVLTVSAPPATHTRTEPLVLTLSGGSASATASVSLTQVTGVATILTRCSVQASSASITVPAAVFAYFAAAPAQMAFENETVQTVVAGDYSVTTKIIGRVAGSPSATITLQ